LFTQDLEPSIRGGDFIAVDDSSPIAGNDFRFRLFDFAKNLDHVFGGVAEEGFGDLSFDSGDFVVQGVDGKGEFFVPGFVGGMDFGSDFTGDKEHEFDFEGEENFSTPLLPDVFSKDVV
jgi:hypothetical protein